MLSNTSFTKFLLSCILKKSNAAFPFRSLFPVSLSLLYGLVIHLDRHTSETRVSGGLLFAEKWAEYSDARGRGSAALYIVTDGPADVVLAINRPIGTRVK